MHPRKSWLVPVFVLAALSGCGSDGPSGPDGDSEYYLSARIDGAQWSADPSLIYVAATSEATPAMITFQGSTLDGGGRSIVFHLARIPGPGTYPLGMNIGTGTGGIASYVTGGVGWNTPLTGAAGTVTISSITESTVTGTFEFVATRADGVAGTVTVEQGRFRVPLNSGFTPATADELGNRVTGTVDGSPWNAATVVAVGNPATLAGLTASNDQYMVTISFGPIDGPGSGPLAPGVPIRRVYAQRMGGTGGWGGTNLDDGTLTIESLTATRVKGRVTGTLSPVAGANGTLRIEDLEFDVRLPQ